MGVSSSGFIVLKLNKSIMKKLLLILTILLSFTGLSQVANYGYTATTSTWASNATPTTLIGNSQNNAISASTSIGFNFVYNGTTYTQFKASSSGFITFNTSSTAAQTTNNLTSSTDKILAVLWDNNKTGLSGNVNYKLTGTSPNRILTVEWLKLSWITGNNTGGTISCQIKLYETTNVIEYIYDRSSTSATYSLTYATSASIGLCGSTAGDFISLSDLKASPTKSTTTETATIGTSPVNFLPKSGGQITTIVVSGTKYRFTPPLINDNCSGAIAMTVNSANTCTTTTSGTSVGGTLSSTSCTGTADDDVWYKFDATQSSHDLRETPVTIGDAVVQMYSGTCASLTSISCIDNYSVSAETYSATGLTSGNTYYVRVHSYANGSGQGTFTMCVTSPCLGTPTSSVGTSVTSSSFSANWSAISGVTDYLLDVSTNNTFTSMVSGYSALSVGNVTTYSVTGLSTSTTYYFRVRVNNSICTNSSTQTVVTKPVNDESDSAITVTANSTGTCTTTTTSTTIGATQTLAAQSSYGTADDDVWYKFVATAPSLDMTVSLGTIGDLVVEAYTSSLVSIGVVDGSFSTESVSFTGLTIGSTYYFRIYSFGSSVSNRGTFTICLSTPPEIATSGTLTSFSSCTGTVSSEKSFSITGYGLLSNITITAPTGFELSTTSGGTFNSPITLTQSGAGVSATTVYVRMKSTSSGSPSGNITCTSTSATTQNVSVSGSVSTVSVGGSISPNQNVASGRSAATVNLTGHTGSVVKWQKDINSSFSSAIDVANTSTSLTGSSMGTINQTVYYRVVVQNGTCAVTNSLHVSITMVTALPIELLYFNGVKFENNNNKLSWSTSSESNNDYFNIERSEDGYNWNSIMTENGAGDSEIQIYYSFVDYNINRIINYYRLKQTDFDGKFKYSDIISVDNSDNKKEVYKVVNILGQEVDLQYYRGLVIIEYMDGSSEKIIK